MRLGTLKRTPFPPPPVSVDAVVAVIGGTAEQLTERFPVVGVDFMGRPLIAAEDAKLVYDEAMQRQNDNAYLPARYDVYQEERLRRRREVGEAAAAEVRANYALPHRGGEEDLRYRHAQWDAIKSATDAFDAENPQLTISQFREKEKAE